jgi:hypothetical protein
MGPSQQKLGEKCGLVALFFTGRHHAGENLKRVLKRRSKQLMTRIQMCDGLARNLPGEFETRSPPISSATAGAGSWMW